MVLQHVADRAHALVELAAAIHAEALGHGDLHTIDVVAVPHRLQHGVGKAEVQQVLHRLLAQVVVDAKDRRLREYLVQRAVELPRRGQVAAERFLHHDAGAVSATGQLQVPCGHREQARRYGQVMQRPLRVAKRLLQRLERGQVVVVAVDVLQPCRELRKDRLIDLAAAILRRLRQAVVGALAQLLHAPARMRHADDRQVQSVAQHHRLQRGVDLLVGQVAGGAEKDQGIRALCRHSGRSLHGDLPWRCRRGARDTRCDMMDVASTMLHRGFTFQPARGQVKPMHKPTLAQLTRAAQEPAWLAERWGSPSRRKRSAQAAPGVSGAPGPSPS